MKRDLDFWKNAMGSVQDRGGSITLNILKDILVSFMIGSLFKAFLIKEKFPRNIKYALDAPGVLGSHLQR